VHVQVSERRTGLCHDVPPPSTCPVRACCAPRVTPGGLRV
jgi:hypothetical protein